MLGGLAIELQCSVSKSKIKIFWNNSFPKIYNLLNFSVFEHGLDAFLF